MNQKDASFALIFNEDNILLFLRDNNPSIPHPNCWQLPGGGIEQGETPKEGLHRELQEEVSYIPKNLKFLGKIQRETHQVYFYSAFVNNEEAKLFRKGEDEGQKIDFVALDNLLGLQLTPALKNFFATVDELKLCVEEQDLRPYFEKHKRL